MAKKGSNKLLLVGVVAAVGYYLYKKSAPAIAVVQQPTLNGQPAPGISTPAPAVQPAPQTFLQSMLAKITTTSLGTGSAATPNPSVQNDPRLTDIRQWISTLDPAKAQRVNNALAVMTQDEIAGLYDIVHNDFYGNGITTPAQRTFWDMWRVKYKID